MTIKSPEITSLAYSVLARAIIDLAYTDGDDLETAKEFLNGLRNPIARKALVLYNFDKKALKEKAKSLRVVIA